MMETAQHIVTQVAQGDFAAVEQRLADRIKPFIPVGTLQATWQGLEQQFGAFQEQGKTSAVQTQDGLVQVVTCVFERASLDVNVVLSNPSASRAKRAGKAGWSSLKPFPAHHSRPTSRDV
ncbi:MAG TPA: DUF3887 domain-containing protein [Ktedonobacteraceae bacterium]|nr:DUF3887 domain-containing protein [Ktedonobacteraceae bacterium]